MKIEAKDRIDGVVFGTAIGDALGYPVEFMSMEQIVDVHGRVEDYVGPRNKGGAALYTDDTQMFRAVCEGLAMVSDWENLESAAEAVAQEFVDWSVSPDNTRAPGASCMAGCRALRDGKPWGEAGPESGGCGAAMRSMAYGIWHDTPKYAAYWASEHANMTHRHPMGRASAAAVAAIVSALRAGVDPVGAVEIGAHAAWGLDEETGWMIEDAMVMAESARLDVSQGRMGALEQMLDKNRGWAGHEAVAASVFCFILFPDSFEDAVLAAVNSPGDSDSLGAITGSFSGAYLGGLAIPTAWVQQIEDMKGLRDLADKLYQLKLPF